VSPFCARALTVFLGLVLLTCFGAALAPALAQEQSANEDEVVRVTTDLLLFPARVRDKGWRSPNGLTEKDLSLKDPDGVVSSVYLSAGVERVAMVFALDQSGSLRSLMRQQRDAALGLYQRFGDKSSIAVLHFAEMPTVAAPFARDAAAAREAFNVAAERNRRTAIFDAAAKAIEMFDTLPPARNERRIVILFSDGLDNASTTKPAAVVKAAREKRVSFYTIHLGQYEIRDGRVVQRKPTKGFAELGAETFGGYIYPGGWTFDSKENVDLKIVFEVIENDLRSQYMLGFYLNEKANDGRRHNFSLSMPKGLEYQISTSGYERTQEFFVARPREALKPRS
jgi:hypothetical protein